MHQEIALKREIEAVQIPSGDTIALPAGTKVIVTQSLGGTFTVATEHGLARISAANADALGLEDDAEKPADDATPLHGAALEAAVWNQLKAVYDPEIPVNIVDLGLVYDCIISGDEDEPKTVEVKMTLTAPGCGMGPTIAADAQSKIMSLAGIRDARVELVWDPVWNREMISEEGKMKLGLV
jgi:probable FeS assembly SUF system protein SufT